jgi:DNA-binding transcriptional ArsR family regulator
MTTEHGERIAQLEQAVEQLTERVANLEQQHDALITADASTPPSPPAPKEIDFALLNRLFELDGVPYAADGVKGAVVYATSYKDVNGRFMRWYAESPAPSLLSFDGDLLAQVLLALSHPARIQLVRLLLREGETDSQTMQSALGSQSAGQLYYHLNSLLDLGLVIQLRRGAYKIELGRASQLLALLATAIDLAKGIPGEGVDEQGSK